VKTTLDLPTELVREMKLRAIMQGRTLRDLATEFLRQGLGLAVAKAEVSTAQSMVKLKANGLPVVPAQANATARRMGTSDLLKLEEQALSQEDMQRARLPL
jgi:hypothetical protein